MVRDVGPPGVRTATWRSVKQVGMSEPCEFRATDNVGRRRSRSDHREQGRRVVDSVGGLWSTFLEVGVEPGVARRGASPLSGVPAVTEDFGRLATESRHHDAPTRSPFPAHPEHGHVPGPDYAGPVWVDDTGWVVPRGWQPPSGWHPPRGGHEPHHWAHDAFRHWVREHYRHEHDWRGWERHDEHRGWEHRDGHRDGHRGWEQRDEHRDHRGWEQRDEHHDGRPGLRGWEHRDDHRDG